MADESGLLELRNLIEQSKLQAGVTARAISSLWYKELLYRLDNLDENTDIQMPPIDNSEIKDPLTSIFDRDYLVIPINVWNTLVTYYGGGPDIDVEVACDPLTGMSIPITRLESYKILFNNRTIKIQISKYRSVSELREKSCQALGLKEPEKYRLRDFWSKKPGKYMYPNMLIAKYSTLSNTPILIEEGEYPPEDEMSESSATTSSIPSTNLVSFPTTNMNTATTQLLKPTFASKVANTRRSSIQTSRNISTDIPPKILQLENSRRPSVAGPLFSRGRNGLPLLPKQNQIPTATEESPKIARKDTQIGICGLQNQGNNCFFNSVLQAVIHLEPFKAALMGENGASAKKVGSDFPRTMTAFMNEFWSNTHSVLSPTRLRMMLEMFRPQLGGGMQQDAHECFTALVELLDRDLKSDDGDAAETEDQKDRVMKIFRGEQKIILKCPRCNSKTEKAEIFTSIMLPLPQQRRMTPQFTFVPKDPLAPRIQMRLAVRGSSFEDFAPVLSKELGRNVSVVYGHSDPESHEVEWVKGPSGLVHGKTLLVFEVEDPTVLHISVRLALNVAKLFGTQLRTVGGPFLIPIPGPTTPAEEVQRRCNEYFGYLWESSPADHPLRASLAAELRPLKTSSSDRIVVEISKSLFSKSMRFKPNSECHTVSRRNVVAIVNTEHAGGLNWDRISRPSERQISPPTPHAPTDIGALLKEYMAPTTLGDEDRWVCPRCGEQVRAEARVALSRLPPVLVIALKRFAAARGSTRKNDAPVTYPDEFEPIPGAGQYRLAAVIEHTGWMAGGHYTAFAKVGESWALFNDTTATECSSDAAHLTGAYMLFYTRV